MVCVAEQSNGQLFPFPSGRDTMIVGRVCQTGFPTGPSRKPAHRGSRPIEEAGPSRKTVNRSPCQDRGGTRMNVDRTNAARVDDRQAATYRGLSLGDLIQRIVQSSDRAALEQLHNHRPLFRLPARRPMLLAPFVQRLCQTPRATTLVDGNTAVLDRAYDLTVDKFAHLPEDDSLQAAPGAAGADCRHYYRSALQALVQWAKDHPVGSPLQRERAAAMILQQRVVRNFRLSCLEAKRDHNPAISRYAWQVNGEVIYLWFPLSVPGSRRRPWLEEHVDDPNPYRTGERARIQAVVDRHLGVPHPVPWDDQTGAPATPDGPPTGQLEEEVTILGLARVVAEEKAQNVSRQRPSIRALGGRQLKRLILCIFEDLGQGRYEEKRLAEAFGLSTATFSRFAGSRWAEHPTGPIPDLWNNVAQTLASHTSFVEIARQAGVWQRVQQVLRRGGRSVKTGGPTHA